MAPVMEQTSVPPWALEPTSRTEQGNELAFDPTATSATVLSYDAGEVASRWIARLKEQNIPYEYLQLVPRSRMRDQHALAEEHEVLAPCFREATVGWRLMIAGPLADVLRARSLALETGLLDEEILVATTRTDQLPVVCAHCGETTFAEVTIGDVVDCAGCGESLLIYHHVSRRRAGFLGFKADAEEWSPESVAI